MTKTSESAKPARGEAETSARDVAKAVADLVSLIEPRLLTLWRETGMTLSHRRLLRRLREGPRSAGEVAAGLGLSAPSLTRMLTRLEHRGLILRTLDKDDRRRVLVELTELGRRSLQDHRVFSGTALMRAAGSLSSTEKRNLTESVAALVRMARQMEDGADA